MENINKKLCYWIEDSKEVRRLSFGCYYPDDLTENDDELMRQKQAEYLKDNINLSNFRKILICERMKFNSEQELLKNVNHVWEFDELKKPKEILLEKTYEHENGTSYFCVSEIISNNPDIVATGGDIVFIVPNGIDINFLSDQLFQKFKNAKYNGFERANYYDLYLNLVNSIPESSLIIYSGMSDVRVYKKIPPFVGTMYSIDIYGQLRKCPVKSKYLLCNIVYD